MENHNSLEFVKLVAPKKWNPSDVTTWIIGLGVEREHASVFYKEEICGEILPNLTEEHFEKILKIEKLGKRLSILRKIRELNMDKPINNLGSNLHNWMVCLDECLQPYENIEFTPYIMDCMISFIIGIKIQSGSLESEGLIWSIEAHPNMTNIMYNVADKEGRTDNPIGEFEFGMDKNEVYYWDFTKQYLSMKEHAPSRITIAQHYTSACWVYFPSGQSHYGLLCGDNDYLIMIDHKRVGVKSNRGNGHRNTSHVIPLETWLFIAVQGQGYSPSTYRGMSTFFVGSPDDEGELKNVGTVDNVACGDIIQCIGWNSNPTDGCKPGKIGCVHFWNRLVSTEELNSIFMETKGAYFISNNVNYE